MNGTDTERLTRIIAKACRLFDKKPTPEMVTDYMGSLGDLEWHVVADGFEQCFAFGKFFPRPGDVRRRGTGRESENPEGKARPTECRAAGCPNQPHHLDEALCRYHWGVPQEAWPEVTRKIQSGGTGFVDPPPYQDRIRLAFLAESGRFSEMEAVCGKRGLDWAREQVKLGHIKPNSWKPGAAEYEEAQEFLGNARKIPEAA